MKYLIALALLLSTSSKAEEDYWVNSWKVVKTDTIKNLPEDIDGMSLQIINQIISRLEMMKFEIQITSDSIYTITDGIGEIEAYKAIKLNGQNWLKTKDKIYQVTKTNNGIRYPIKMDAGGTLWLHLTPTD